MAEEKKAEEKKVETPKAKVNLEAFVTRKLKTINEMSNKAKAKSLAERVLRNKEVK